MSLLLRALGLLGNLVLRLLLVVGVLFAGHLLLSRVWPELRRTASAIEQAPLVERELAALEGALNAESANAQTLEKNLTELGEAKLRALQLRVSEIEQRIAQLEEERSNLQEQISSLQRERDEYCSSYNPLKRWSCREFEQRFSAISERLTPIIAQLDNDLQTATRAVERVRHDVGVLTDPNLTPEERVVQLGDDAAMLSLTASASRRRIAQLNHDATRLREELARVHSLQASPLGLVLHEWRQVQWRLLAAALMLLALPWLQRTLNYFVLMPLITRWGAPLRLASAGHTERVEYGRAQRSLVITLAGGQIADVRAPYARPVQGKTRSKLLYRWSSPFISYASGLRLLTRIEGDGAGTELTLAAPHDPHSYLMRLELPANSSIVVHPKHLVGVIGEPKLSTRWRLGSLHAWCTWQLRYILLQGPGSIIIEGHADVVATEPGGKPTKLEQDLVIGFDTRLELSTARTETFLPYLLGKTSLVDDLFTGDGGLFWQKSIPARGGNIVSRTLDAFWSAIGKVLGF